MSRFVKTVTTAATTAAEAAVTTAITTAVTAAVTAATTATISRVADGLKSRQAAQQTKAEAAAEKFQLLGRTNAIASVNGVGIAYIGEYTGLGQNPVSPIQGFKYALIIGDSVTDSSVSVLKSLVKKNWKVIGRMPIQEARLALAELEREFIKNPPRPEATAAPATVEAAPVSTAPTEVTPAKTETQTVSKIDELEMKLKDLESYQKGLKKSLTDLDRDQKEILSALKALNNKR